MAANYTVLASRTITELVPTLGVRDVQEVTITAQPSGVVVPLHVQMLDWNSGAWKLVAQQIATAFNDLADEPGVADVQVEEDVNRAGQIVQTIVVTVESDDGMQQQDIRLSWGQEFRGFGGYDAIAAARTRLNDLSGV